MIAWLFSGWLQAALPFWLPFAILAATEVEFVVQGWRETRGRRAPIRDRARAPASRRRRRRSRLGRDRGRGRGSCSCRRLPRDRRRSRLLPGLSASGSRGALFGLGLAGRPRGTAGRQRTPAERARAERAFKPRPPRDRRAAGDGALRRRVRLHGRRARTLPGSRFRAVGSPTSSRTSAARSTASASKESSGHATTRPSRSRCSRTKRRIFAASATRPRQSASPCRRESKLGERLGVKPETARALMQLQLDRDLSDDSVARLDYRLPAACQNGGTLDLRPADPSLPLADGV